MAKVIPLDKMSPVDEASGDMIAVIETPKGCRNKYDYDPDIGCMRLAAVLPEGMTFPFDFGFIPFTKAEDGDPLDVMVLLDQPVPPGCVVTVRIIGAIEAEQRAKGKEWVRNDRLVAVPTHAHLHGAVKNIKDINPKLLDELEAFFQNYNCAKGVEFRVIGRVGPKEAHKLIEENAR
jgi:inorganic pyrophosphatase